MAEPQLRYLRLLYDPLSGKIFERIPEAEWEQDWVFFNAEIDKDGDYWILYKDGREGYNIKIPLSLYHVPYIVENKILCKKLLSNPQAMDGDGDERFSVQNEEVVEKPGWSETTSSSFIR